MCRRDLSVEVVARRPALPHARSIESRSRRFNALAGVVLLMATVAHAADVPGVGRVTASGYLDGRAVAGTEDAPRQLPQRLGDVTLEGTPASAVTLRLETRGRIGGPFVGGSGPAVYNFDDTYQNHSPSLDFNEAWGEWRGRRAEVRLGIQKFVWGQLDGIPPTDIVSPRDFHDPLVDDFEERKIGIPAVQGTYYLPDLSRLALAGLRVQLAYIPFAVPPRLALFQERWFPTSIAPIDRFRTPLPPAITRLTGFRRADVGVDFETLNRTPPRQFDEGGIAFRPWAGPGGRAIGTSTTTPVRRRRPTSPSRRCW
jgi:hypothetical protein